MDHQDHVNLLRKGISRPGGVWADLGSGTGAFTLALAELIGGEGQIHSVDKDRGALRRQARRMRARFPEVDVHYHVADFRQPLALPPLDGAVMANALHFLPYGPAQEDVIRQIHSYLRPGGRLLLVEYNTGRGNRWVPYPLTFAGWQQLARHCGFQDTTLLSTRPSSFLGEIYSALSQTSPEAGT
jgi:SAM-dependent methyltransferase